MNVPLVSNEVFSNNLSPKGPISRTNHFITSPNQGLAKNTNLNQEVFNYDNQQDDNQNEEDRFKVFIRWRPLDQKEKNGINTKKRLHILKKQDKMIFVFDPDCNPENSIRKEKTYVFDDIFDENEKTIGVYKQAIKPAINNVLNGFNSTVFAYGMTGAGKTFTMFGDINNLNGGTDIEPGLIGLTIKDIFNSFALEKNEEYEFSVKLSYLEIYNEHARDLLTNINENLMIVEDPQRGVMVPNLTEFNVTTLNEVIDIIQQGNSRRVMASTHANQFSSRSHAIIQIIVEKRKREKDIVDSYTQSKLSLVDLAGSERAATSENKGLRLQEGANINRSLLALGNCINILSDINKKGAFVPYRDSKLTRLLKDSLGGNTRTIMVACISPSCTAYEETINTLKYANRARNIKKKITQNVKEVELHVSQYKGIIEALKKEINFLRARLLEANQNNHLAFNNVNLNAINNNLNSKHYPLQKIQSLPIPSGDYDSLNKNSINNIVENSPRGPTNPTNENTLDELSNKLFANLEENWEIIQTIKELTELKAQNELEIQQKNNKIEITTDEIEKDKLNQEIKQLNEVMNNNDRIYNEVQQNLQKNQEEKKKIQENIKLVTTSAYGATELAETCKNLNVEKCELYAQNQEIMQAARNLAREKDLKESKIMKLEKEMQLMKKKLVEKDRVIAKNQELIKNLTSSKNSEVSRRAKLIKESRQYSVTHKEKFLDLDSDKSNRLSFAPRHLSATQKRTKSPKVGIAPNLQQYQFNQGLNNLRTYQDQNIIRSQNYNMTSQLSLPSPMNGINTINNANNIARQDEMKAKLKNHMVGDITKQKKNDRKYNMDQVSIQELKSYAEKLKSINFENVTISKPKKKIKTTNKKNRYNEASTKNNHHIHQQMGPDSINYLQNVLNNKKNPNILKQLQINSNQLLEIFKNADTVSTPSNNNNINMINQQCIEKKGNANTNTNTISPPAYTNSNQNFGELSSIIKDSNNMDASLDTSIKDMKDILIENFPPKFDNSFLMQNNSSNINTMKFNMNKIQEPTRSNTQNDIHSHPKNLKIAKSPESSLKKVNQEIKIAKNSLNPHDNTSRGTNTLLKPGNDNNNQIPQNIAAFLEKKIKPTEKKLTTILTSSNQQSDIDNLAKQVSELDQFSAKNPRRKTATDMSTPTTLITSSNHLMDTQQSSHIEDKLQREIRSLDIERDLTRAFKLKIYSLSFAVDNNLLDNYYIEEISACVNEYNQKKYFLNNNDYLVYKKLESIFLGIKEPKNARNNNNNNNNSYEETSNKVEEIKPLQSENQKVRSRDISPSKNVQVIPKKNPNLMIDSSDEKYDTGFKIPSPKSCKTIKGKDLEESKLSKLVGSKGLAQGMISNMNSDYGKALNKSTTAILSSRTGSLARLSSQQNYIKGQYPENSPNMEAEKPQIPSSEPATIQRQTLTPECLLNENKVSTNEISEFNTGKNKQNLAVQTLIEKQKKHLKEEFDKLQKQNYLRLNTVNTNQDSGINTLQGQSISGLPNEI